MTLTYKVLEVDPLWTTLFYGWADALGAALVGLGIGLCMGGPDPNDDDKKRRRRRKEAKITVGLGCGLVGWYLVAWFWDNPGDGPPPELITFTDAKLAWFNELAEDFATCPPHQVGQSLSDLVDWTQSRVAAPDYGGDLFKRLEPALQNAVLDRLREVVGAPPEAFGQMFPELEPAEFPLWRWLASDALEKLSHG